MELDEVWMCARTWNGLTEVQREAVIRVEGRKVSSAVSDAMSRYELANFISPRGTRRTD